MPAECVGGGRKLTCDRSAEHRVLPFARKLIIFVRPMLPDEEAAHSEALRWVKLAQCRDLVEQRMACQETRGSCAKEQAALNDCLGPRSDGAAHMQLQYRAAALFPAQYAEYSACMDCAQDRNACYDIWLKLQVASAKPVVEHMVKDTPSPPLPLYPPTAR